MKKNNPYETLTDPTATPEEKRHARALFDQAFEANTRRNKAWYSIEAEMIEMGMAHLIK